MANSVNTHKLGARVAGLLSVVLIANGLADAPEDQVARFKLEILALAKSVGPPPEKSPEAPPQSIQTIIATGDWEFSLEFAGQIANEQSRANVLVSILSKISELSDLTQAGAAPVRVANVAGGIGNDTAQGARSSRLCCGCCEAWRCRPGA